MPFVHPFGFTGGRSNQAIAFIEPIGGGSVQTTVYDADITLAYNDGIFTGVQVVNPSQPDRQYLEYVTTGETYLYTIMENTLVSTGVTCDITLDDVYFPFGGTQTVDILTTVMDDNVAVTPAPIVHTPVTGTEGLVTAIRPQDAGSRIISGYIKLGIQRI